MRPDPYQLALNAVENSNGGRVGRDVIDRVLASGDGEGRVVRAVFGDCPLVTLDSLAAGLGIAPAGLRRAYLIARERHEARNEELETMLDQVMNSQETSAKTGRRIAPERSI